MGVIWVTGPYLCHFSTFTLLDGVRCWEFMMLTSYTSLIGTVTYKVFNSL